MKLILKIFFILFCVFIQAQKKPYFLIDSETKVKKKVKDSASAVKFLDSLAQNSYFFTQLKEVRKKGDTTEIFFHKGKNFNVYINELRINYIVSKLKTNPMYLNYKVSYLADECGFSSHSSFSTVFKNCTGIKPNVFIQFLMKDRNENNKSSAA